MSLLGGKDMKIWQVYSGGGGHMLIMLAEKDIKGER